MLGAGDPARGHSTQRQGHTGYLWGAGIPSHLAMPGQRAPCRTTLTEMPLCRHAQVGAAGQPARQVPWHRAQSWL